MGPSQQELRCARVVARRALPEREEGVTVESVGAQDCVKQPEGLDGLAGLAERLKKWERITHRFKVVVFQDRVASRRGHPHGTLLSNCDAVTVEQRDEVF